MDRIDKLLSNNGGLSRADAKLYIKNGRIKVNGAVVKDPGLKVSDSDEILVDGKAINTAKYRYFMLNKPEGYISSTEPEPGDNSPNVISLFKSENIKGLFPVGRLDKDTTGLLIITNDGELGHRLTAPGKHVDKTYLVKVRGELKEDAVSAFEKGFEFKEFTSAPAKLEILDRNDDGTPAGYSTNCEGEVYSAAKVTISEGKFHQVKRMFLKIGCEVVQLKRLSMGKLCLDENLAEGEYRELNVQELEALSR
ncbi:MAG: rRNA pseudouridine synthase [Lachnospiraceae bacterium]|nr:rRNA pseudouridine synthase [Lachnospiraceae bacterium]